MADQKFGYKRIFSNSHFLLGFAFGVCSILLLLTTNLQMGTARFYIVRNLGNNVENKSECETGVATSLIKLLTESRAVFVRPIGGLGNKLFQFASGFALANNQNSSLFLCNDSGNSLQLLDQFRIQAPRQFCNLSAIRSNIVLVGVSENNVYEKTVPNASFLSLGTYFESEIFFKDYKKELKAQLTMPELDKDESISEIANRIRSTANSVAVHIRRGDFLTSNAFLGLPITYQINAMRSLIEILVEPTFFVFTNDMTFAKEQFESAFKDDKTKPIIVYMTGNLTKTNVQDFYLMRLCRYFIIANSTFSWWAAYLSDDAVLVIAPRPRYDPMYYMTMWNDEQTRVWKRRIYGEFAYPEDWTTMDPFLGYSNYYNYSTTIKTTAATMTTVKTTAATPTTIKTTAATPTTIKTTAATPTTIKTTAATTITSRSP